MEKVTGIGGLFFRSSNPKDLSSWYEKYLGISLVPDSYETQPWQQQSGPTVIAPFDSDTTYFGSQTQMWMVNFRVNNLDAMVAQLRQQDIDVEVDAQDYPNGRFARLEDPEGNPIQLWQPKD